MLLAMLAGIYVLSEVMQQQTVRWMAMKRRDDLNSSAHPPPPPSTVCDFACHPFKLVIGS
jgi:hypothetical protein